MSARRQATRLTRVRHGLTALALAAATTGCDEADETQLLLSALEANHQAEKDAAPAPSAAKVDINPRVLRRFQPLRSQIETIDNPITVAKTDLGRMLYFEPRLSKAQKTSCNTCHALDHYGVDNLVTSVGHRGQHGTRNSPTVYNAAGFFTQFWDGRAGTVEEQASGPILNPMEMALASPEQGVKVLNSMPEYRQAFSQAFPGESEPVTLGNAARAIAAFERRLTTPSRWDAYLRGDQGALSVPELEGLKVFTNIGCMVCHTGEFVGGAMYQKVGIVEPWPDQRDQGRFAVTKQDSDRMMFKVPTLRNITMTAPYFHDGSVATLDAAVRRMGRYQLGLTLSDQEVAALITWLGALTGEIPADYVKPPLLPPSTASTPLADPT
jgi:cytochrome c peroxidase